MLECSRMCLNFSCPWKPNFSRRIQVFFCSQVVFHVETAAMSRKISLSYLHLDEFVSNAVVEGSIVLFVLAELRLQQSVLVLVSQILYNYFPIFLLFHPPFVFIENSFKFGVKVISCLLNRSLLVRLSWRIWNSASCFGLHVAVF